MSWTHHTRDVVSVEMSRSRDVTLTNVSSRTKSSTSLSRLSLRPMRLGSRLSLRAVCLGLTPVGLVSGLGPLHLVETFCEGARRAYYSCRTILNQHDICGLDIFI